MGDCQPSLTPQSHLGDSTVKAVLDINYSVNVSLNLMATKPSDSVFPCFLRRDYSEQSPDVLNHLSLSFVIMYVTSSISLVEIKLNFASEKECQ